MYSELAFMGRRSSHGALAKNDFSKLDAFLYISSSSRLPSTW